MLNYQRVHGSYGHPSQMIEENSVGAPWLLSRSCLHVGWPLNEEFRCSFAAARSDETWWQFDGRFNSQRFCRSCAYKIKCTSSSNNVQQLCGYIMGIYVTFLGGDLGGSATCSFSPISTSNHTHAPQCWKPSSRWHGENVHSHSPVSAWMIFPVFVQQFSSLLVVHLDSSCSFCDVFSWHPPRGIIPSPI